MVDAVFKICIFGDGGVGKTTLTERFLMGFFSDDTKMTLGASFYQKNLNVENMHVALQIWDFGGEEIYRTLFPNYIRGSAGAIFMYDITRYSSLNNLKDWLKTMDEGVQRSKISIIIVGGKLDLEEKRVIPNEEAEELKERYDFIDHIECSSRTGENVDLIFSLLTYDMLVKAGAKVGMTVKQP